MANKCSHEETRLSCIECCKPICSNCLIQCPVGFRCRSCTKVTNPAATLSPFSVFKSLAASSAVGFGGGWLMPFIQIPFLSCIICYFMGLFIGRWLNGVIDDRLRANRGKTVVFGLLIGMSLSPLTLIFAAILGMFGDAFAGHGTIPAALEALGAAMFSPVCFVAGVLRSTLWGERW